MAIRHRLPTLKDIPLYPNAWGPLRNFLVDVKEKVEGLIPDPITPGTVEVSTITPYSVGGNVEITWEPVNSASSYRIYRNTSRDLTTAVVIAEVFGNETKRFVDKITVSDTYYYWIAGVNSLGVEGVPYDLAGVDGVAVTTSLATDVSPNERVEIDSVNGIRVYDSGNNLVAQISGGIASTVTADTGSFEILGATSEMDSPLFRAIQGDYTTSLWSGLNSGTGAKIGIDVDASGGTGVIYVGEGDFDTTRYLQMDPDGLMVLSGCEIYFIAKNSSNVSLRPNGTTLQVRLGDNSNYGDLSAGNLAAHNDIVYFGGGASTDISLRRSTTTLRVRLGDNSDAADLECNDLACDVITPATLNYTFGGVSSSFDPNTLTDMTFVDGILVSIT